MSQEDLSDKDHDSRPQILLDGISIENFRSYDTFPSNRKFLPIGRFTTIIGKNDVGKSNFLYAILLVLGATRNVSQEDFHKRQLSKSITIKARFKILNGQAGSH